MHGLFMLLNDLVESAAALLLDLWARGEQGHFAAPPTAWNQTFKLDKLKFRGFGPEPIKATEIRVSPADAPRLILAGRVRRLLAEREEAAEAET